MSDINTDGTKYHESKIFKDVDFVEKTLRNRAFHKCKFISCNFTKSDLRTNTFEDCIFERCNFSMAEVEGVGFQNAKFVGCKILGVNFSRSNRFAFSFYFEECTLDYSVFVGTKLQKTKFINCSLREVDFAQTDLTSSLFTGSDLLGTLFSGTILEKADFRTAKNFSIDPEHNRLKKAKFSSFHLENLLHKYQLDIE